MDVIDITNIETAIISAWHNLDHVPDSYGDIIILFEDKTFMFSNSITRKGLSSLGYSGTWEITDQLG